LYPQHPVLKHPHSLRSTLNVSDQVSHPFKTTDKIIVIYILICIFLDSKIEDKRFFTDRWQDFPNFKLLLISSGIEFLFFKVFPLDMRWRHLLRD
jgi:hypothetical protein